MPRLPDHEIIASLQTQVSHLRIQLRNAEALIPADVKESLTTEIKETADAVIRDFDALRDRIEELEDGMKAIKTRMEEDHGENARFHFPYGIVKDFIN